MKIFKIYGGGSVNNSSFTLQGVKTIYDDGQTPINTMQTTMAVLNWISTDSNVWLFEDGSRILFDDGSTIKIDNNEQ